MAQVIFYSGDAQIKILPKGYQSPEPHVIDIRRAMGVSSFLLRSNLSPARLEVKVGGDNLNVPQSLANFGGLILFFVYEDSIPLTRAADSENDGKMSVSLGVSAGRLVPAPGEGVLIEFSVIPGAGGVKQWDFRFLGPAARRGGGPEALQELGGGNPVYHQVYWNGRRHFTGEPLRQGRYVCALRAWDEDGQLLEAKEEILLQSAAATQSAVAAALDLEPASSAQAERKTRGAVAKPPETAIPEESSRAILRKPIVRVLKKRKVVEAAQAPVAVAEKKSEAVPQVKVPETAPVKDAENAVDFVSYDIYFNEDGLQISSPGKKQIDRAAHGIERNYPLAKIRLIGYANIREIDARALAKRRAEVVASLLKTQYGVEPNRLQIQHKVLDSRNAKKVAIYVVQEE